jgi:large subunit ribosomal protein L20
LREAVCWFRRNPSCFPRKIIAGFSGRKSKPMARVKRGTKRRARRKKYLKRTKGFFLTKSKLYQSAQEAANRADRYAKRDRRVKKREYRKLWIQRVGAAARNNGLTYGQLIHGLKAAGVALDRKVLADIAVKDAAGFAQLVEKAKAAAPPPAKAKQP